MDSETIERMINAKLQDIDTLSTHYALVIDTPKVEARYRSGYNAVKELSCHIDMHKDSSMPFLLNITWPHKYPVDDSLQVEICGSENTTAIDINSLNRDIERFSNAFVGNSTGCALDIVQYAVDMLDEQLEISCKQSTKQPTNRIHVIKFNHLLKGPEHKKEKDMVSGARGYSGGILYGTPGIVALLDADDCYMDYISLCRSIGKRGELVYSGNIPDNLATMKIFSANGLSELTMTDLQTAVGGVESFRENILGIS